jgi:hypothetical protein
MADKEFELRELWPKIIETYGDDKILLIDMKTLEVLTSGETMEECFDKYMKQNNEYKKSHFFRTKKNPSKIRYYASVNNLPFIVSYFTL